MGQLNKNFATGSIKRCRGHIHGFAFENDRDAFFIDIGIGTAGAASTDDGFRGYAMKLNRKEAKALKKVLDRFLETD